MQDKVQGAEQAVSKDEPQKRSAFSRGLRFALGVAVIFMLGVFVGEGRLSLHSPYDSRSTDLPARLDYTSVNELYDRLKDSYDGKLTEQQLLDGMKSGLANATNDPYTEYFTAKESKAFNEQVNNSFSGIGAELGKDEEGNIQVVAPIAGYPAEKAGLKARDVIVTINDQSTSGLTISDAVDKIRGEVGTKVKLQVIRNKTEPLEFTITREQIQIKSVEVTYTEDNIGVITISTFGEDTSRLMNEAAREVKQKNVKGIILDLRGNPGGLLSAAVDVSSHWLPSDKVVLQEKRGNQVIDTYNSSGTNDLGNIPTVVLIDEGSASASEIVTGALRDHDKATVIGVKSYGKGVVQQLLPLKAGGQLKVTVASWYRPNGQNINKKGITPDKEVKMTTEQAEVGQDPQKDAALERLRKNQ